MNKDTVPHNRFSNTILIYKMMLHYWNYMVSGFVAMLLFAFFSGASVTLVIPLFDYVFFPGKTNIIYHRWDTFLQATMQMLKTYFSTQGSMWEGFRNYSLLWTNLKELMLHTDSLALLYILCVFVLGAMLFKNIFFYLQKILFTQLRGRTIRDVRNYMFSRYLSQSLDFFGQNQVGDAIVRMVNDVEIVSERFINSIFNALRELATILVFARIAYLLNHKLFLYSILVLPLFSLMISYLGKKIKKYSRRIQEQLSTLFSIVEEVLNSMKIVQAFRHEQRESDNFAKVNNRHFHLWSKAQNYDALNMPISEINSALVGVVVIVIGGNMILTPGSTFSLGDFTAFLFALFSMLHPLKILTQVYTEIRKALVSLDRIALVMNHESQIKDKPDAVSKAAFEHEIRFDNVSFYYKPSKMVLKDLSFTVPKGTKLALVGASGGGKTTIANLMNRMYDVKDGSITIDGIDIRDIKLDDLRRLFGVVTQDSVLFTKSIRDNIAYGSQHEVSDAQVQAAAKIANADEYIQDFPLKYDEVLGNKGSDLSGGQKQRLCIARAVVADPPILIFDEATSALDTDSEKKVQDAIDLATKNRTVVMIAHRLSTVLKADKIIVLEKGCVVGMGSHAELLVTCPRYKHLHSIQQG
ncbi:MAG: ABC transporter ATP-binding protein [Candidatus Cloacimonas sp.]|jgi:subfamily B ATP-binding cassette protein MsbA|nr:ABC transporter ATP-binding protein [Candidatus Cloacimonas sp.]